MVHRLRRRATGSFVLAACAQRGGQSENERDLFHVDALLGWRPLDGRGDAVGRSRQRDGAGRCHLKLERHGDIA